MCRQGLKHHPNKQGFNEIIDEVIHNSVSTSAGTRQGGHPLKYIKCSMFSLLIITDTKTNFTADTVAAWRQNMELFVKIKLNGSKQYKKFFLPLHKSHCMCGRGLNKINTPFSYIWRKDLSHCRGPMILLWEGRLCHLLSRHKCVTEVTWYTFLLTAKGMIHFW